MGYQQIILSNDPADLQLFAAEFYISFMKLTLKYCLIPKNIDRICSEDFNNLFTKEEACNSINHQKKHL